MIKLTMSEWFAYRLMYKENETYAILFEKLFQLLFIVGKTMIESERMF